MGEEQNRVKNQDISRYLELHIEQGPVLELENYQVGIVTEWDYINKVLSQEADPSRVLLKEIMTAPLTSVTSDTPMEKVASLMAKKAIRRLLVIDNNKLSGIITSRYIFFQCFPSPSISTA